MRGAEFMSQQENLYEPSRIGENVVNLRESKNYSQAHLAELMNLNKNVLGRIERGERPLRDTEILKLAEIFHVSTDLILDNQTEAIPDLQKNFLDYRNSSQKDISKQMSKFLDFLKKEPNLTFSGKVLSSEERKNITTAFEVTSRLISEQLSRK
ncbi:helix-turn-helix transcriptional regulator [Enterococcus sp. S52]|nr:helix-turn-helix transcriptional regulator [Enterococcus sp. S52]MBK0071590.1 helix-turn-helix transcriptional regulator [Enterococcus sp. S53]MBK0142224.1 helix-turn-helix transcriptional regulator [Enterococcus sp. S76]MBK0145870.1 helix-turn-helix transcriptional regulator [Enterococcus sp. S77]